MATEPIVFDLEYHVNCPKCAAVGRSSKLGLVADEGIIRCDGPEVHSFADLPGEPAAVDTPELAAKRRREAIISAEISERETGSIANILPEKPTLVASGWAPLDAEPEKPETCEVSTIKPELPALLWVPQAVGGGDVFMLCRFSEAHIAMLQAEAENQNQTLGEYMLEWLTRAEMHAWI